MIATAWFFLYQLPQLSWKGSFLNTGTIENFLKPLLSSVCNVWSGQLRFIPNDFVVCRALLEI